MSGLSSFTAIAVIAVLAPLASELVRRRVPSVVIELVAGIIIGEQVLGIAEVNPFIDILSTMGLAFLFFMAGYEIEFQRIRGDPLRLAVIGWFASLAVAAVVAGVLVIEGWAISELLVSLVLTTTALGTILPMLSDAGETGTKFGSFVLAIGAAGEFLPIVAIALLLSGDAPVHAAILLIVFVAIAAATIAIAVRPQPPRFVAMLERHVYTSTQLPIRIAVLLIAVLVWVAAELGLDILLGAFVAGLVVRLANRSQDAEIIEHKLAAVGFGLLIPVFFVVSGMEFDLDALLDEPTNLLRLGFFFGLFLLVRGLPVLLIYRKVLEPRDRAAAALLAATCLPLVVAITSIGLETDRMTSANAAALVGAAMLTVLVFPLVGLGLRSRRDAGEPAPESVPDSD